MKCRDCGSGFRGRPLNPLFPLSSFIILFLAAASCGTSRKIAKVRQANESALLKLPSESELHPVDSGTTLHTAVRDTLKVTGLDGREVLIMRAIKDSETGEMVATEQIDAAVVTARFRNVAERHGKVNLEFQVIVPAEMQDSRWQLRFHPDMSVLDDSVRLDDVVITGEAYRKAQLKGYQQYNKFISRIVSDTLAFVDMRNLELFIERNIPQLYTYKTDSTYVSDEQFASCFGVTDKEAIEHYTNRFLRWRNDYRKSLLERKWHKYVKAPIVTEGIRLDTVTRGNNGDLIYNYVQTIGTRPGLRNVSVTLSGEIYEQEKEIYTVPRSSPLTFYISSVSSFADETERFLTRIISRNAQSDVVSHIDFSPGDYNVEERLGSNKMEISRIKKNLRSLLTIEGYEMDSIIIIASASPDGAFKKNNALSYSRAKSVSDYFSDYIEYVKDSLRRDDGMFISVGDDLREGRMKSSGRSRLDIKFKSRSGGENWAELDDLVAVDSLLTDKDREEYRSFANIDDYDARESAMKSMRRFRHISEDLYPKLRTVRFDCHLHRKGMIKDTVHTTVLDSVYMRGVKALKDHDYESAVSLLSPYRDFNAALACIALDRNKSALSILNDFPRTAPVNYLLAIVKSREGDERDAVEYYIRSCQQDHSFVYRGNLDPEISILIKKYKLNEDPPEDSGTSSL